MREPIPTGEFSTPFDSLNPDKFSMDHPVTSSMSSSAGSGRVKSMIDDGLRSQWTADKLIQAQERSTNWLLASAADLSPSAFWAALETASPWASLGEYVLDLNVSSEVGRGR
jgi:hypothetical protein